MSSIAPPGPAESVVLRAWLVVTDGGERVRLAHDAEGRDLIPTPQEQARAATERAETAEAKVQQLEEELARLRAKG